MIVQQPFLSLYTMAGFVATPPLPASFFVETLIIGGVTLTCEDESAPPPYCFCVPSDWAPPKELAVAPSWNALAPKGPKKPKRPHIHPGGPRSLIAQRGSRYVNHWFLCIGFEIMRKTNKPNKQNKPIFKRWFSQWWVYLTHESELVVFLACWMKSFRFQWMPTQCQEFGEWNGYHRHAKCQLCIVKT